MDTCMNKFLIQSLAITFALLISHYSFGMDNDSVPKKTFTCDIAHCNFCSTSEIRTFVINVCNNKKADELSRLLNNHDKKNISFVLNTIIYTSYENRLTVATVYSSRGSGTLLDVVKYLGKQDPEYNSVAKTLKNYGAKTSAKLEDNKSCIIL